MPEQFTSDWVQQTLMAPEAIEATLKIGVIPETDHLQLWIEVKDPMTGVLLGQASNPHAPIAKIGAEAHRWQQRLVEMVLHHIEPF